MVTVYIPLIVYDEIGGGAMWDFMFTYGCVISTIVFLYFISRMKYRNLHANAFQLDVAIRAHCEPRVVHGRNRVFPISVCSEVLIAAESSTRRASMSGRLYLRVLW
jgi:hypothetical protein